MIVMPKVTQIIRLESSVTDWIRSAKFEIRNKKEKITLEPRLKSEEQTEREKTKVITEEKYLRELNRRLQICTRRTVFLLKIWSEICVAQELMKELSDIFVRIEAFHSDLPMEFGSIYEHQRNIINSCIQDTRKRITEIKVTNA